MPRPASSPLRPDPHAPGSWGCFSLKRIRHSSTAASAYLAHSAQENRNGGHLLPNASFVVGGTGAYANFFIGSLTGTLRAGHDHSSSCYAYTDHVFPPDGGNTAAGFARLDIGEIAPASVPAGGSTLGLLGLAVAFLSIHRRQASRT